MKQHEFVCCFLMRSNLFTGKVKSYSDGATRGSTKLTNILQKLPLSPP